MNVLLLVTLGCWLGGDPPADDSTADTTPPEETEAPDPQELDDERVRNLDLSQLPAESNPCAEPALVRVETIIDGDTAWVDPQAGGADFKVRLNGIDAPELAHNGDPAECYSNESGRYLQDLVQGDLVWLTFGDLCTDSYDRTLAYAHRDLGEEGFVNRVMVRQGYAWAYPFDTNNDFKKDFQADEDAARAEGLGMWGACD
ncbi:thermonuclease family protein [Myxococcota bacterium]|nr:thermonuclease family protein [Myxococcota bacterium]